MENLEIDKKEFVLFLKKHVSYSIMQINTSTPLLASS